MNSFLKNIIGFSLFAIIVSAALGFLLNNLTKKSEYEDSGTISAPGLNSGISVYTDDFGVPFIYAESERDLYFALGYYHAKDRLWQMDLYRRVAQGRLAEVMGRDMLDYDILFRTLGIDKSSSGIYEALSSESKQILTSYAAGINFFLEKNISRLPLEFDILNYKPEPWLPEHSVMIVRMMAWEINLSWYTDVMFAEVVNKVGEGKAMDFFPSYPEDGPFIKGSRKAAGKKDTAETARSLPSGMTAPLTKGLADNFFELSRKFRTVIGSDAVHVGSNAWVVSGKRTESGKPLLANDPHLSLMVPAKWYEASLYNGEKRMNVCGFTLPGAPGIAAGHNGSISWGITSLMNDDSDFYLLTRDSADSRSFTFGGRKIVIDSTVESIKIKDSADDYQLTVYRTPFGPVVSNLSKTGFAGNQSFTGFAGDRILTFRWTGYEISDEFLSFYKINFAQGYDQFKDALKTFGSPGLNFVYSDTSGNIAFNSAGLIPLRDNATPNTALYPSGEGLLWKGFVPFSELPGELNPERGFIVTANNKPQSDYQHYISNLYEPHYRAERIEDMLERTQIATVEDMKLIQRDVFSIQAREFCSHLLQSFGDSTTWSKDIAVYLGLLKDWDYEFRSNSPAAALFAVFEAKLYENLYFGPLGEKLFENYIFIKNIPVRNTSRILSENSTVFFASAAEKDQILRKSFYDAVSVLIAKFGGEPLNWEWGDIHKITLKHPLGVLPAFSTMLNIGPFKSGGSGTTVNNMEYSFAAALKSTDFGASLGPSMRMIVDLKDAQTHYSILPGGQSGQPLQENYANQARLWANGDYRTVSFNFDELIKESLKLFIFETSR